MEISKREYLTNLYKEFKEKTKEYIKDCSVFPDVQDLDLFDLLYYIGVYFNNPKYYDDSFNTLLILYDIELSDKDYINAFNELKVFIEKVKEVK